MYQLTEKEREEALKRAYALREKLMARNTGRGSRIAAQSPTTRQFVTLKKTGGSFKSMNMTRWKYMWESFKEMWR